MRSSAGQREMTDQGVGAFKRPALARQIRNSQSVGSLKEDIAWLGVLERRGVWGYLCLAWRTVSMKLRV